MARDGLNMPLDPSQTDRLEERIRAVRSEIDRLEKKFRQCKDHYAKAQAEADNVTREVNLAPKPAPSLVTMVKTLNQAAQRAVHAKILAERNLSDKRMELAGLELAKRRQRGY